MTTSWCSSVTLVFCRFCTVLHSNNFPHELVENNSHVLLYKETLCGDMSHTLALVSDQFSCGKRASLGPLFPPCQVGSVNGHRFGSRSATRFRRLTWKIGYTWVMTPPVRSESNAWLILLRWYRVLKTKIVPPDINDLKKHLRHRDRHCRQAHNMICLLGNYLEPRYGPLHEEAPPEPTSTHTNEAA